MMGPDRRTTSSRADDARSSFSRARLVLRESSHRGAPEAPSLPILSNRFYSVPRASIMAASPAAIARALVLDVVCVFLARALARLIALLLFRDLALLRLGRIVPVHALLGLGGFLFLSLILERDLVRFRHANELRLNDTDGRARDDVQVDARGEVVTHQAEHHRHDVHDHLLRLVLRRRRLRRQLHAQNHHHGADERQYIQVLNRSDQRHTEAPGELEQPIGFGKVVNP